MKYTRYFSKMIRQYGAPQLEQESFQRVMNIIYLEARRSTYLFIKERNKGKGDFYKYDHNISRVSSNIKELSLGLEPEQLMKCLSEGNLPRSYNKGETLGKPWPEHDVDLDAKRR